MIDTSRHPQPSYAQLAFFAVSVICVLSAFVLDDTGSQLSALGLSALCATSGFLVDMEGEG